MTILLRDVPKEVKKIILQVQSDVKLKKNVGKYSQEKAIYQIIKDYWGIVSTLKQVKEEKETKQAS